MLVERGGGDGMARDDEFTEYVAARWRTLVRAAVLLGCSRQDAEDVVQSALSRCYVSWPKVTRLSKSDIHVAQEFARFARGDSPGGPFDTRVGLGSQGSFVRSIDPTGTAGDWEVPPPTDSGISGSLSALRMIRQFAGSLQLTSDSHVVCATRPATGPSVLTGGGDLVSIQPPGTSSCLQWFSIDLYVDDVGHVVGVDLRVGSP
jgi:hypothetical protein